MSTEMKLIEMGPVRFEPHQPMIKRLEELLQLAKEGQVSAVGVAVERMSDGVAAVDWFLVGRLAWPTALIGAIEMLADEAKEVAREKIVDVAT